MSTVSAKQLHQETKFVLNQLEQGESFVLTRNGRPIGRIEPITSKPVPDWAPIMAEVWEAQKKIKTAGRVPNPVLAERSRRRR